MKIVSKLRPHGRWWIKTIETDTGRRYDFYYTRTRIVPARKGRLPKKRKPQRGRIAYRLIKIVPVKSRDAR